LGGAVQRINAKQIYLDEEPILDARKRYFMANGIPADGGASEKWARYKIGSLSLIAFPNFQHRMDAIVRHDLHHIILNLDTTSLGEGLIAAWELGSGCGGYWISWCLESQALWWGVILAPQKTFDLFVLGRHSKNYFHEALPEDLSQRTVGESRQQILPLEINSLTPRASDWIQFIIYCVVGISLILIFTPVFLFFTVVGALAEWLE
jgi:hypothetical protein